ncbi:hypothetical protein ACLOJK_041174 [Asimina triloba]
MGGASRTEVDLLQLDVTVLLMGGGLAGVVEEGGGRDLSLSRHRRAAWPLAAAGDGRVGRLKEMQMGWIGEDDGAPYCCSVLRRSTTNCVPAMYKFAI